MSARRDHPEWRTRPGRGAVRVVVAGQHNTTQWADKHSALQYAREHGALDWTCPVLTRVRGNAVALAAWRRCAICGGPNRLIGVSTTGVAHLDCLLSADRPLRPRFDNHYPELP